jgi:hypothetical protein
VHLSTLGRFTSIDPISGGNANPYVYPGDPVNLSDITRMWPQKINASWFRNLKKAELRYVNEHEFKKTITRKIFET